MRIAQAVLCAALLASPALTQAQQQRDVHQGYYDLREATHTTYSNGSTTPSLNMVGFGGFYGNASELPADWQDQVQPISRSTARRLPAVPSGYRYGRIGERIVVYNPTTGAVLGVSRQR